MISQIKIRTQYLRIIDIFTSFQPASSKLVLSRTLLVTSSHISFLSRRHILPKSSGFPVVFDLHETSNRRRNEPSREITIDCTFCKSDNEQKTRDTVDESHKVGTETKKRKKNTFLIHFSSNVHKNRENPFIKIHSSPLIAHSFPVHIFLRLACSSKINNCTIFGSFRSSNEFHAGLEMQIFFRWKLKTAKNIFLMTFEGVGVGRWELELTRALRASKLNWIPLCKKKMRRKKFPPSQARWWINIWRLNAWRQLPGKHRRLCVCVWAFFGAVYTFLFLFREREGETETC